MALDFNLLRPTSGPNPVNAFFQGQQDVARNALAQEEATQNRDLNALRRQQVTGQIQAQEDTRRRQTVTDKTAMFRERLLRARDPNSARELIKRQYADPDLAPIVSQGGTLDQALAEVPEDPVEYQRFVAQQAMGMADWIKSQQPKVTPTGDVYNPATGEFTRKPQPMEKPPAPPVSVAEYNLAQQDPNFMRFLQERAAATRAPVAGGAGAGTREGVSKPMTPVQSAKRRDQLGKEFKSAQNALQTTQDVLDSIAFVKAEPGLSRATGFTGTLLPSIPEGAAASAETRLKNLEGKVTALGKAQAAASGAIGSIANQEWKILADQIAAIDRAKGTGPLLGQLELVEAQAQGAMERIKDAYQRQFGEDFEQFPQFADLPVPKTTFKPRTPAGTSSRAAPAGAGNIDALLEKYK